jgi:prepilin-type N-terminal cleavage/methylation domain-containing protein
MILLHRLDYKKIQNRKGFTLIELLMVIAIIGIISSTAYDSKIKQQLVGFRRAAEIYYTNQNNYGSPVTANCAAGIFADTAPINGNPNSYLQFTGINPAPVLVCNSSGNAYAVQSNLIFLSSSYWCVDSKNNAVIKSIALGTNTVCQ